MTPVSLGGRERAGQVQRNGVRIFLNDATHERGERFPRIAIIGEGGFRLGDVPQQTVQAELLEQLFLTSVAPVERANADPGTLRDRGDRRVWVGCEDLTCGLQNAA